jgi:hypothetical protein
VGSACNNLLKEFDVSKSKVYVQVLNNARLEEGGSYVTFYNLDEGRPLCIEITHLLPMETGMLFAFNEKAKGQKPLLCPLAQNNLPRHIKPVIDAPSIYPSEIPASLLRGAVLK